MGEEDPQMVKASNGRSEEQEEEELFYETIEAPKYVDLSAPDPFLPGDDRYWFCARVGCDQKHEEEIDPEAIYKNFVLRVMAARSPNVRLRKALYKKDSSLKCPQTVPAKPSKPRVQRLALISSLSKKIVDPKIKVKPPPSRHATAPSSKLKQPSVVTKAFTTPRKKELSENKDVFRSVRHPKTTAKAATSNRVVAKTLVFHSPKKAVKTKTSLELKTPVKELCSAMKKLDISGGKKRVLGYNRPPPSDRKQLRGREVQSRFCDGLSSQKCLKSKNFCDGLSSQKCLKSKNKELNLLKSEDPAPVERDENDITKELTVEQLKNDTAEESSNDEGSQGTANEGDSENAKVSTSLSGEDEVDASSIGSSGGVHNEEGRTEGSSSDKCSSNIPENDTSELSPTLDDKEENNGEAPQNDDKENVSASHGSRELDVDRNNISDKSLGRHEILKGAQKTERAVTKLPKKISTNTATVPSELKQRKPKPTNPKPFRLRTDERGILKEANLEKKHVALPLKEITLPTSAGANAAEDQQRNFQQNKAANSGILEEKLRRKVAETTPQRHTVSSKQKLVSPKRDKAAQKYGNSLRRGESHASKRLAKPRFALVSTKVMVSVVTPGGELGVIKEATPTISRLHEEPAKPSKSGASIQNRDSLSTASKQIVKSKSKRLHPREPKFHAMHMPKSCTRRVVA